MPTDLYIGQLINFGPVLMEEAESLAPYYHYHYRLRHWRLIDEPESATLRDDEFSSILRIPV